MTLSDLIKELRAIVIVHPEAAQAGVLARNGADFLSTASVRLHKKCIIIEGIDEE